MKYPALTPYHYCGNNPVVMVDPDGKNIEVVENGNGTFTIVGGTLNKDKNIYIMKNDQRTGDILGQTFTEYSFFNEQGQVVKDAVINPNDNSGQAFLDNLKSTDPGLISYAINATNGGTYDFKSKGGNNLLNHYRGMPIKESNSNNTYCSARDIGNYGAGYVAGRNNLSYCLTRFGFDAYQSYKDGSLMQKRWSTESIVSRSAQNIGFSAGIKKHQEDLCLDIKQWGAPMRLTNGHSFPKQ